MNLSDPAFIPFAPEADSGGRDFRAWQAASGHRPGVEPIVDEYARGLEEGQHLAETAFADERRALAQLVTAAQALQPVEPQAIRSLILETVERLVSEIVGHTPVDRTWLIDQVDRVFRIVGDVEDRKILWVNPEDAELLADAGIAAELRGDPAMVPGSIRLELNSGWIEHGRMTMLDALRSTIGQEGYGK